MAGKDELEAALGRAREDARAAIEDLMDECRQALAELRHSTVETAELSAKANAALACAGNHARAYAEAIVAGVDPMPPYSGKAGE